MSESIKACNLCGSDSLTSIWREKGFRLMECASCHLRFLNPQPSATELEAIYSSEYFRLFYLEHQSRRVDYFRERISEIQHLQEGRRLLDVGCGPGYFLIAAREAGWSGCGVDIAASAIEYARVEHGLDVIQGSLEQHASQSAFDMVTMWNVLAHLADPAAHIKLAHRALRPGGFLVVQTPYRSRGVFFAASVFSISGRSRSLLHAPAQLYHFTPATLRRMMETVGFRSPSMKMVREIELPLKKGGSPKQLAVQLSEKLMTSLGWYHSMIAYGQKL